MNVKGYGEDQILTRLVNSPAQQAKNEARFT